MQLAVLGGSALLSGGFFTKVALLGASVAGSMLLNGRKKPVGKINDLRVSSASYGRGIPWVWGTMRVTGNMFWATDFREEKIYMTSKGKQKTGAKGKKKEKKGKAQPMYKYYANFAMGLCKGPVDEVLRIWADNNLIFNKYNPDDEDLVTQGFSTRDEDEDSGKGSQKSAGGKKGSGGQSGRFVFRFYSGSSEQMPDPFMEKEEGTGNVPGYRDLCYLMFENFALEDFGNRTPTITAEITTRAVSKPMVLRFDTLEDPDDGWKNEFVYPTILDIQRDLLYVGGVLPGNLRTVIRVFDIAKREEVDRIDFFDILPQTAPHGTTSPGFIGDQRTWYPDAAKDFVVQGVTPGGDLIIYRMEGNYGTLIFFDPNAKRIIKSWGINGNYLPSAWNGIFAQGGTFNVIAQRDSLTEAYPEPLTVVYEVFGKMHLFDSSNNKIGQINCGGWRENHCIGTPGTTQALYFSTVNHGGTSQYEIYTAQIDIPIGATDWVGRERLLGKWPAVEGSKGWVLSLAYLSYCVGANCVSLIFQSFDRGTTWLVKMDPVNGKILWEQQLDIGGSLGEISNFTAPHAYNNTNYTNFWHRNTFYRIDWRQEKVESEPIKSGVTYPNYKSFRHYWSERDAHVTFIQKEGETDKWQPAIVYNDRKVQANVSLAQICEDISTAVGIPREKIITTGLETQEPLNGYMVEQPTEARSILEELANCYQFDAVESDYQLRYRMRGGESIKLIPDTYLLPIDVDFGTDNERIVETIQQQSELPERVTVSYFDPKNDYENGAQYFKRPTMPIPVAHTHEHMEVTFNMAILNKYAKRLAKRILYAAWSERTTVEFKLPRDYITLDPSDTITLQMRDGRNLEVRLTDITTGADMALECAGVYNYPDSYKHTAETENPEGLVTQPPVGVMTAKPLLFNIPYLADAHEEAGDSFGFYWAAGAPKAGFSFGMLQSMYNGSSWRTEGVTQLDAIWGYVGEMVPEPGNGWNIEDRKTKIRLIPAFNFNEPDVVYTWEAIPDAEWPSENNMVIIGDEVILFKDVIENPDGTVVISRLIRGYRGSIDAAYRHTNDDRFTIVHGGSVHMGTEELTYLNEPQVFLINTGTAFANLSYQLHASLNGSTEKPLPVGDVRRVNVGDGSVTFNWSRSTRIGGALKNGTGNVPLAEEVEKYLVFITAAPFNARTWNPDDPTKYVWKSAELTTSTVNIPSATLTSIGLNNTKDIHIVIHQLSNEVGYGYPHGLTKYYSRF